MIDWNIEMHLIIICALHISTAALMPSIARIFSSSKKVLMAAPFVSLRSIDNDVNNNNMEICELEREVTSIAAVGPEKTFRAHNFIPNSFLVPQFLATNCHWQTIIGSRALQNKIFGVKDRSFHAKKERILTPDGDFFDVEFTEDYQNAKGLVIISHGLESSARGEHVSSFAKGFISKGFGCCLVNYRGCSGEPNRYYKILTVHTTVSIVILAINFLPSRRVGAYHLGFTTDLKQLISELNLRHPNLKLFLCGFSLGGNVSLKLLGELGSAARTEMNLLGAAVTCVPFDPIASQGKLDKGFNRAVYSEVCMYVCMYVCSVTYFIFILYICVWVYWVDGNKFMYVCMYVCMCIGGRT